MIGLVHVSKFRGEDVTVASVASLVTGIFRGPDEILDLYVPLVILSAAKDLTRWTTRSFAALRMTQVSSG